MHTLSCRIWVIPLHGCIQMYTRIVSHARTHTHTHAHAHTRTRAQCAAHTHTHTHAHTRAHARTHTPTHPHTHTPTHPHTHTRTHAYTKPTDSRPPGTKRSSACRHSFVVGVACQIYRYALTTQQAARVPTLAAMCVGFHTKGGGNKVRAGIVNENELRLGFSITTRNPEGIPNTFEAAKPVHPCWRSHQKRGTVVEGGLPAAARWTASQARSTL